MIESVNRNSYSAQIEEKNANMIKSSTKQEKLKIGANTYATDVCMSEETRTKLEKAKLKLRA